MGPESSLTGTFCPRKQGSWLSLICFRIHSTTTRRTKEPGEELVTYCSATKQSEVTTQHRPGLLGLVMEETDNSPSLHPRCTGTVAEVVGLH